MRRSFVVLLLAWLTISAGYQPNQVSAAECINLPPTRLHVYNIDVPQSREEVIPAAELSRKIPADGLVSLHSMMVTIRNLVSWVRIQHRAVPQANGTVCDAPEVVDVGLGSDLRKTLIADSIADDVCVRRQLQEHEGMHSLAFGNTVDRFIAENETIFREGMVALKKTAAPSFEKASARWSRGVQLIIDRSKQALLADLQKANSHVDSPETLKRLALACDGKIQNLEQGQF